MAPQRTDGEDPVTVETYRPSEYVDASWQVVSDTQTRGDFIPAQFASVGGAVHEVDTMFADFSGASGSTIELSREAGDFELHQSQEAEGEGWSVGEDGGVSSADGEVVEGVHSRTEGSFSDIGGNNGPTSEPGSMSGAEGRDSASAGASNGREPQARDSEPAQFDEAKVREALQEAYEQGCVDTRQEVSEVQHQLEERYRLLWEDMQVQLDEALRANELKAVELALGVAKRMVGEVVETNRDYILRVMQEAIKLVAGAEISSVRVSPQDYEFLKLSGYGDDKKIIAGRPIAFESDDSIRAGCVLVTSAGEVDFDLDKAWERMRAKVLQEPES